MPDKRHWSAALAAGLANLAGRIDERHAKVTARDAEHTGVAVAADSEVTGFGPARSTDPRQAVGEPVSIPGAAASSASGTAPGAGTGASDTSSAAASSSAGAAAARSAAVPAPAVGSAPPVGPATPAAAVAVPRPAGPLDPLAVVPWSMRVAAEIGWRLLVLAGTVWVLMRVIGAVRLVVLAFAAALLITALLQPFVARLKRAGVPRGLATAMVCIGGFVLIALVGWFVVWQVMDNVGNLSSSLQDGIDEGKKWLLNSPLHVTDDQINQVANNLSNALSHNTQQLTDAGLQGVTFIVELLTGMLLAMFSTLFLLYDGPNIWNWVLKLFPEAARDGLAGAGPRAWRTLTLYVRGTVIVAFIDALFIGVGIFFLRVPMAVPLAVVIFLCSFVPLVGAVASGAIAVVVALVTEGPFTSLMVLVVVLAVQQIEGHILQPFILGRAVRVHPLAVVLSVAAGSMIAGIGGAVVAVPLVAVGNTVVSYLKVHSKEITAARAALAPAAPLPAPDAGVGPVSGSVSDPVSGPVSGSAVDATPAAGPASDPAPDPASDSAPDPVRVAAEVEGASA